MNARRLITVVAVLALTPPAAAVAKTTPGKHPAKHVAELIAERVAHRVICICFPGPFDPPPVQSRVDFEAAYDQNLIEAGLEPIYRTTALGRIGIA